MNYAVAELNYFQFLQILNLMKLRRPKKVDLQDIELISSESYFNRIGVTYTNLCMISAGHFN